MSHISLRLGDARSRTAIKVKKNIAVENPEAEEWGNY